MYRLQRMHYDMRCSHRWDSKQSPMTMSAEVIKQQSGR